MERSRFTIAKISLLLGFVYDIVHPEPPLEPYKCKCNAIKGPPSFSNTERCYSLTSPPHSSHKLSFQSLSQPLLHIPIINSSPHPSHEIVSPLQALLHQYHFFPSFFSPRRARMMLRFGHQLVRFALRLMLSLHLRRCCLCTLRPRRCIRFVLLP